MNAGGKWPCCGCRRYPGFVFRLVLIEAGILAAAERLLVFRSPLFDIYVQRPDRCVFKNAFLFPSFSTFMGVFGSVSPWPYYRAISALVPAIRVSGQESQYR